MEATISVNTIIWDKCVPPNDLSMTDLITAVLLVWHIFFWILVTVSLESTRLNCINKINITLEKLYFIMSCFRDCYQQSEIVLGFWRFIFKRLLQYYVFATFYVDYLYVLRKHSNNMFKSVLLLNNRGIIETISKSTTILMVIPL